MKKHDIEKLAAKMRRVVCEYCGEVFFVVGSKELICWKCDEALKRKK